MERCKYKRGCVLKKPLEKREQLMREMQAAFKDAALGPEDLQYVEGKIAEGEEKKREVQELNNEIFKQNPCAVCPLARLV